MREALRHVERRAARRRPARPRPTRRGSPIRAAGRRSRRRSRPGCSGRASSSSCGAVWKCMPRSVPADVLRETLHWTTVDARPCAANSSRVPAPGEEPALVLVALELHEKRALELERHEPHGASTAFRAVNASANRSGATLSIPRRRISARNVSRSNQCFSPWRGEVPLDQRELLVHDRLGQRHEDVRPAEVAVELRDLVLEDQMVAERVPRQLRMRAGDPGGSRSRRGSTRSAGRPGPSDPRRPPSPRRRRTAGTRRGTRAPRPAPRRRLR